MKKIVIFTKNVLAEKRLRDQLEILNYEVFVTKTMPDIEQTKIFQDGYKLFNIVIISETLSNKDYLEISNCFSKENNICFRRTDEEDSAKLSMEGLHYISVDSSLSELREKLSNLFKETKPFPKKNEQCFHEFHNSLSKLETIIIRELSESLGTTISREELCKKIWQENVNSSRLVQISTAIRNIRNKALKSGVNNLSIMTYWGRGYELSIVDEISLKFLKSNLKSS